MENWYFDTDWNRDMSEPINANENICPIHGKLIAQENAIFSIDHNKINVSVSLCNQCQKYYSQSKMLPRNAKMSYKGLPLIVSDIIVFQNDNKIATVSKGQHSPIKQIRTAEQQVKGSKELMRQNGTLRSKIALYLIPKRTRRCPSCDAEMSTKLRAVFAEDKTFKKVQVRECANCNRIYVLQNVYEHIALHHILDVEVKDDFIKLNISDASLWTKEQVMKSDQADTQEAIVDVSLCTRGLIDTEQVIAWLTTQRNANGTIFLERVVRQYIRCLKSIPPKFSLTVNTERNVFKCNTVEELSCLWSLFRNASNYKQVNASTSGMFSAGMSCQLRYLKYLSETKSHNEVSQAQDLIQTIKTLGLKYVDKRSTGGVLWVIGGQNLNNNMMLLRDTGYQFAFKKGGGRASDYQDAWWLKSTVLNDSDLTDTKSTTNMIDLMLTEKLTDILASHFSNGFRLNSTIELTRFRSFVAEELNVDLSLPDEDLKSYISASGINYDGKIYIVTTATKKRVKVIAEEHFFSGAQVIFFNEFYSKNESWLFCANVVSEDMLTSLLREIFPKLSFTQTYFGYTDTSISVTLESEILRVWGDQTSLTYSQLAERLNYIPLERIKLVLCQNSGFIWCKPETFSHVSRIEITNEEREIIRETATRACSTNGYVPIAKISFEDIEERNCELSSTAIHNAIYQICLSDIFDKHGKIITRKGESLDVLGIMKEHCRTIDKCTLDDLHNFETELTGESFTWISTEAGNAVLVRIDKNIFVAERYVRFYIESIDRAIALSVCGDYLPLKSFSTFGAFPDCGHTWNLYLLESFCRRFSREFRFDSLSINTSSVGTVVRKNCSMDYTEIMASAVINADIPLKSANVGQFLVDSGYMGRRRASKVNEIIKTAKALREKRI